MNIFYECYPDTLITNNINEISIIEKFKWDCEVETISLLFKKEYEWDGMFNEELFYRRIENEDRFFLFKINEDSVGYIWCSHHLILFNPFLKIENFINNGDVYVYNLFISKYVHDKSKFFVSEYPSKLLLKLFEEGYQRILFYVDGDNKQSKYMVARLGGKRIKNY